MSFVPSPIAISKDRIFLGIGSVCIAFFLFTLMQMIGKLMTGHHHVIEIVFYRNIIAMVPFWAYIVFSRKFHLFQTKMPSILLTRVFVGTVGMILTFAAVQHLPMANATVLFFASTLIVPVAAHFFLKETIGIHRWAAIALGFSGVLLIAQPSAQITLIGVILALAAACCHAYIQVILRVLRKENEWTITFYFLFGGAVMTALFMPFIGHWPSAHDWFLFLLIGIAGGLGQYFLTLAFKYAPASLLSPFNYTGLIWATGFDILIWDFVPDWHVYAGAFVIIAAKLYIIYRARKAA